MNKDVKVDELSLKRIFLNVYSVRRAHYGKVSSSWQAFHSTLNTFNKRLRWVFRGL